MFVKRATERFSPLAHPVVTLYEGGAAKGNTAMRKSDMPHARKNKEKYRML